MLDFLNRAYARSAAVFFEAETNVRQINTIVNKLRSIHTNWSVLLMIVLLGSCSSQGSSDGDQSARSADSELGTNVGAGEVSLQIRYSSGIRSIFEDSKGRFWFGSHKEGVCLWDGNEFLYYTVGDGLSDNQVRTIQEDQAGVIWFGTGNGITSFDGEEFRNRTGRNQESPEVASGGTWHMEASDLWFLGDSGLHAGDHDGQGVYRYNGRALEYLAFPLPREVEAESPYLVTGIVKGRDGTVWFGTYPGVFGYDGQSFTIINDQTMGNESGAEPLHIRSLFEDSRGNLWIGNNGLGVLLYDGQTVENFTEQHGLSIREKGPIGSLGRVFSIAEDAAGNIWFGTRDNGAWRFNGMSLTNFTREDGLTSPMVWSIYRDSRDALWFGMGDGNVCRFNGKSFDKMF
jgi:ligand-binding sensor domain-containing protein